MKTELTYSVENDGEWWIAKCKALDIAAVGPNRSTALQNLNSKVNFYLSETPYLQVEKDLRMQGIDIEIVLIDQEDSDD